MDQHGDILDILVPSQRHAKSATRSFRTLLTGVRSAPIFETATYMIDGVFDHLPVTAAVQDGLDGDFLLLDFDEAQGIGYIE